MQHDETAAADLQTVIDGRGLSPAAADRLIRAVTGAVRPNRDKPAWEAAHALVALGLLARRPEESVERVADTLIDMALDPACARPERLAARCAILPHAAGSAAIDGEGVLFDRPAGCWRARWAGVSGHLALVEFCLTCDGLAHFAALRGAFATAIAAQDAEGLTRAIVQILVRYRAAHMPLAQHERRFRDILAFLGGRKGGADDGAGVDDAAVLGFWRAAIAAGERPGFPTIAGYFATFMLVSDALTRVKAVHGAGSIEEIPGWAEHLEAAFDDFGSEGSACGGPLAAALRHLAGMAETPKILTGAERALLAGVLVLAPLHQRLPLTVLRSESFGPVQSGIANRLRRGGGGLALAERIDCAEAEPYPSLLARHDALATHLARMLRLAIALRGTAMAGPEVAAMLAQAEADIARVRRAGFDAPRTILAAAFAAVDGALADAARAFDRYRAAARKLGSDEALAARHAADRAVFAATLSEAYREEMAHERADFA